MKSEGVSVSSSNGGKVLGRMGVAVSMRKRLLGLFDKGFKGDLLVIAPCRSIHTFGMSMAVDAAFFDRQGVVLATRRVAPWRFFSCPAAEGVVERAVVNSELSSQWFSPGDQLCLTSLDR